VADEADLNTILPIRLVRFIAGPIPWQSIHTPRRHYDETLAIPTSAPPHSSSIRREIANLDKVVPTTTGGVP
jgi:hypothetical protein